ncbi:protein FAM107B [Helicoverpa armigera]|uniref:protein FAM107B n=1 Tax=Helicoverpa armigera TaxID=29058 RepID=UPI000B38843A|nr:protein FAM107B [Helicoverpa armigera]XP_047019941.1 protein FAM107B [Helicoverpa zea]
MCDARPRKTAPAIQEKLAIYENVLSVSALSAGGGVGPVPTLVSPCTLGTEVEMVQEGVGAAEGLIAPRRVPNPCLESPQRMDLHRELLFNQKIGKNVLNQKSELEKALSKHKEKQIMNQVKEHRETPELERAIAERARRLEQAEQSSEEPETGANPTLQQIRARLRHAAPASAASAH